jgi:hypothetical protein
MAVALNMNITYIKPAGTVNSIV